LSAIGTRGRKRSLQERVARITHVKRLGGKDADPVFEDAMNDEPEQEALFYIEGPDERGCVRMHGASSADPWSQNLGPAAKVAEVLSQWLASIDDAERSFGLTQDE
jgi:hypothetical protein